MSHHHPGLLDTLAELTAHALPELAAPCLEVAESIKQSDHYYFLGTGPSYGTAQYAAAKMWEVGEVVTFAFELEEFGHGPHMLINAAEPAFIIAPTGHSVDRARLLLEGLGVIGAKRVVITDNTELFPTISCLRVPICPKWSPFGTTLAVQWLCWAIATAKGYDVLTKDGVHPHPELYEQAHWRLVRDTSVLKPDHKT
ncbi:MAG: SIS domain-containing protein [Anaerolineae bacterium]